LDQIQRELRQTAGVTAIVYDQTCAAEKRRRRKRGTFPDPNKRLFINSEVCEGCGDCGEASNCVAVKPLETELGRKRTIDQSSCNKDYSCVKGFCPSFVSVIGGTVKKNAPASLFSNGEGNGVEEQTGHIWEELEEPILPQLTSPWNILVCGIGGTGVVTIGALLGTAAHLDGLGVTVMDQVGLAQKGGSVVTHVRIAAKNEAIKTNIIGNGKTDLLLGCDMLTAADPKNTRRYSSDRTKAVMNLQEQFVGYFASNPDMQFPGAEVKRVLKSITKQRHYTHMSQIATNLLGDSIAGNMLALGVAYQRGLLPISQTALMRAIEMNGQAVKLNQDAFEWGRRTAVNVTAVLSAANLSAEGEPLGNEESSPLVDAPVKERERHFTALDELVLDRSERLERYQDKAYAEKYKQLVLSVVEAEQRQCGESTALSEAVARYYFKLLAYKDEYEVARLYATPKFQAMIAEQFDGCPRLEFHLAPALLSAKDPVTGAPIKRTFGPWILHAFKFVAGFKQLRGTAFDPFGYQEERERERELVTEYEAAVALLIGSPGWLSAETLDDAIAIASIPEQIRGFGHVKAAHIAAAKMDEGALLSKAGLRPSTNTRAQKNVDG
jgi:indolepyruvate ferredoxin oxidoreductase